ncbi:transcription factor IIIB 50 kDa subunit [Syngnathoides biaculeatus]|uniref:transcription factor IIIB 50 kDa subunit n=1 Tax=Syngnathoides biaculeatus TaxID=300417 RepID=UPI002ADE837C|nr:transcription factor IIIB 50 kDa subunit [Syngnathoides biaculeatus]
MSAAALKCLCCGSSSVVEEDHYTQRQMVCVDCGAVASEGALTHDTFEGTDISYSRTTAVSKKPCLNQRKGLQRLTALCRVLRVNSEIERIASEYFARAYEHESFLKVSLQKKEILVGCCVLASCRQLNWPVSMGTIGCLLEADMAMTGAVYQEMMKVLRLEVPHISVSDVMESHCKEYKISSLDVEECFAEDHRDIQQRALSLIELAADSWIVTGRRPVPLMMATVYLAWQSLNPTLVRLNVSLPKFCRIAKVRQNQTAAKRVGEIKTVLCKLGKEIPWVTDPVTSANVVRYVDDIVKNRYALLRRALRSHEQAMQEESQLCCEKGNPSEQENQTLRTTNFHSEKSKQPGEGSEFKAHQDLEPNWGKRMVFAPPCVIHAKRRRAVTESLEGVTGHEEISDSEIESYIRTPQEVREFALAQKAWLSQTDQNKCE